MTKARVSVVVRQGENLYSVMNEVLKELSSISGERVGLGAAAANQFFQPASPNLTSTGEAASTFLDDTALTLGVNFWQVLYALDLKLHVLSFPGPGQPE